MPDHAGNVPFRSKDLVEAALRGHATPRPATGPLAVHYCARLAGFSLREYTLNPRILAECVLRYYERYHPDAVWLSADTWVTAQAMGAAVGLSGCDLTVRAAVSAWTAAAGRRDCCGGVLASAGFSDSVRVSAWSGRSS